MGNTYSVSVVISSGSNRITLESSDGLVYKSSQRFPINQSIDVFIVRSKRHRLLPCKVTYSNWNIWGAKITPDNLELLIGIGDPIAIVRCRFEHETHQIVFKECVFTKDISKIHT